MADQKTDMRKRPLLPALVAVVAGLAAAALLVAPQLGGGAGGPDRAAREAPAGGAEPSQREEESAPGPEAPSLARRKGGDPMALGKASAPVVMVEYADFQCPFCGRFARETEPALIRKYVEKGTLRIEWRDFPYLGEESTKAARAGRAAAQQGRFWEFHDVLYADQPPPNSGRLTDGFLIGVAKRLGLDTDRFRTTMNSDAVAAAVQRDFAEGQSAGVTGTPAFVVNGRAIMGAQPTEVFEQAIEDAAAVAR